MKAKASICISDGPRRSSSRSRSPAIRIQIMIDKGMDNAKGVLQGLSTRPTSASTRSAPARSRRWPPTPTPVLRRVHRRPRRHRRADDRRPRRPQRRPVQALHPRHHPRALALRRHQDRRPRLRRLVHGAQAGHEDPRQDAAQPRGAARRGRVPGTAGDRPADLQHRRRAQGRGRLGRPRPLRRLRVRRQRPQERRPHPATRTSSIWSAPAAISAWATRRRPRRATR